MNEDLTLESHYRLCSLECIAPTGKEKSKFGLHQIQDWPKQVLKLTFYCKPRSCSKGI